MGGPPQLRNVPKCPTLTHIDRGRGSPRAPSPSSPRLRGGKTTVMIDSPHAARSNGPGSSLHRRRTGPLEGLRLRQVDGHVRRQHAIGPFIVDPCVERKIIPWRTTADARSATTATGQSGSGPRATPSCASGTTVIPLETQEGAPRPRPPSPSSPASGGKIQMGGPSPPPQPFSPSSPRKIQWGVPSYIIGTARAPSNHERSFIRQGGSGPGLLAWPPPSLPKGRRAKKTGAERTRGQCREALNKEHVAY